MATNGKRKTAPKTAPLPPTGGMALPLGNHPGNTGGKKGRSGRKPDEFKRLMAEMASNDETLATIRKILANEEHPLFVQAWKHAAAYGYGMPTQRTEVTGKDGGPIETADVSPLDDLRGHLARIAPRLRAGNGAGPV